MIPVNDKTVEIVTRISAPEGNKFLNCLDFIVIPCKI